ncbi:MAG: HAD family phosphatase [Sphingomonadales bacterium]|jgi:2-haloacid dehalogenase
MTIRAVIFDIGNVLVRWDPRYLYQHLIEDEEELEHFLSDVVTLEWHTAHDAGLPMVEGVRRLSEQHPHYAELIDEFRTRWFDTIGDNIKGSIKTLEQLHKNNVPLFALTNFSAETFPRFARENDYMRLFKDVLVSGEVGLVKPDPRIFELAVQRFSIDPASTLFIDDRLANVEAAQKKGLQTHLFEDPQNLEDELRRFGLI